MEFKMLVQIVNILKVKISVVVVVVIENAIWPFAVNIYDTVLFFEIIYKKCDINKWGVMVDTQLVYH